MDGARYQDEVYRSLLDQLRITYGGRSRINRGREGRGDEGREVRGGEGREVRRERARREKWGREEEHDSFYLF